jgi:hypothetical protein
LNDIPPDWCSCAAAVEALCAICGDGLGLGIGKFVEASTGAEASKAARRSSSSVEGARCGTGLGVDAKGFLFPVFSKISQN